MKKFLSKKNK